MKYVKIRSWHVVKTPTRAFGTYLTLCGKTAVGQDQPNFLSDERTCESCFRIAARQDAAT